ncbi:hypothetical protein P692DRAFT_20829628, partial [Suillus brevipes Sb2]
MNLLVVVICPATGGSSILTVCIAVSKLTFFCDIKHYQGSPVLAGTKQRSLFPIK